MSVSVRIEHHIGGFTLDVAFDTTSGIGALFGPSGAGKTLTLRCIAGLMRPDRGAIRVGGRTLLDTGAGVDVPTRDRGIGYVFQQYGLFPHLTVEGNVGYGLSGLGRAERSERVARLLALVGLAGLGGRRAAELSGGQQQRVAIARALATEPRLLLLDEPFAAVDMRVRRGLRAELRRIQEESGTPMLLVTHDLTEVRQLAGFTVVLDGGRVVGAGGTLELLRPPLAPRLAELLDE